MGILNMELHEWRQLLYDLNEKRESPYSKFFKSLLFGNKNFSSEDSPSDKLLDIANKQWDIAEPFFGIKRSDLFLDIDCNSPQTVEEAHLRKKSIGLEDIDRLNDDEIPIRCVLYNRHFAWPQNGKLVAECLYKERRNPCKESPPLNSPEDCTCGIYGWKKPPHDSNTTLYYCLALKNVYTVVKFYGLVWEFDKGFRSSHAQIVGILSPPAPKYDYDLNSLSKPDIYDLLSEGLFDHEECLRRTYGSLVSRDIYERLGKDYNVPLIPFDHIEKSLSDLIEADDEEWSLEKEQNTFLPSIYRDLYTSFLWHRQLNPSLTS